MAETLLDFVPTTELRNSDVLHIIRNLTSGEAPGGVAGFYDMEFTNQALFIDDTLVNFVAFHDDMNRIKNLK